MSYIFTFSKLSLYSFSFPYVDFHVVGRHSKVSNCHVKFHPQSRAKHGGCSERMFRIHGGEYVPVQRRRSAMGVS